MAALSFFVPGRPQTAGSKTAVPMGARMGVVEAGSRQSRARKRTWRGDLRDGALRAIEGMLVDDLDRLWNGPVAATFVIVRRRPNGHLGTGRNVGVLKDWAAELLPVQRPDTLKIVRAAEDALTGVIWSDDSQLVSHRLHKVFADQVGLGPLAEGLLVSVGPASAYDGPPITLGHALAGVAEVVAA